MYTVWLFLLLGTLIQVHANIKYFERSRCVTQPGVLKDMDISLTPGLANVFLSMKIECDGKVKLWEFFAKETGSMFLGVWRRDQRTSTLKIVGKNRVTAEVKGYNSVEIPLAQRISVQNGDFLGVHYETLSDPTVITVQTSGDDLELGEIKQASMQDSALKQGAVLQAMSTASTVSGVGSFKATVAGVTEKLILQDGPKARATGRPEIKKQDIWGTICDKWFVPRGWPLLFCYELGYPGVLYADKASSKGLASVPDNYPIHSTNPKCKPSANVSIADCPEHELQTCNHEDDIFIACKPKVRPVEVKGKAGWAIPEVFDFGIWGDICDNRGAQFHLDNPQKSWVTAFCAELDLGGLKNVESFTQTGVVTKSVLENPDCGDVPYPTNLYQCPSGPLETECDGNNFYVQCDQPFQFQANTG